MGFFTILPPSLAVLETWLQRIFLFLGAICIGPWIALLIYDALLFLMRLTAYEIPYIGGRARNRPRPRAPSLSERPSGAPRKLQIPLTGVPPLAPATSGEKAAAEVEIEERLDTPPGYDEKDYEIAVEED